MTKCDPVPPTRRNFVPQKILTGPVVIVSIFMAQIGQLAAITIAFGVLGIGGIYIVPDVFIGFERGERVCNCCVNFGQV